MFRLTKKFNLTGNVPDEVLDFLGTRGLKKKVFVPGAGFVQLKVYIDDLKERACYEESVRVGDLAYAETVPVVINGLKVYKVVTVPQLVTTLRYKGRVIVEEVRPDPNAFDCMIEFFTTYEESAAYAEKWNKENPLNIPTVEKLNDKA